MKVSELDVLDVLGLSAGDIKNLTTHWDGHTVKLSSSTLRSTAGEIARSKTKKESLIWHVGANFENEKELLLRGPLHHEMTGRDFSLLLFSLGFYGCSSLVSRRLVLSTC